MTKISTLQVALFPELSVAKYSIRVKPDDKYDGDFTLDNDLTLTISPLVSLASGLVQLTITDDSNRGKVKFNRWQFSVGGVTSIKEK